MVYYWNDLRRIFANVSRKIGTNPDFFVRLQEAGTSKLGAVLRVTNGNFLEQFDFFLFGFYATYISKAFFPASSDSPR